MTSCKSGRKHMHRKPNKSRKVRKSNNLNRNSAKGSRKASQKGRKVKGSKKGRKGKRSRRAMGDRMTQVMSMIRSRFSKREEEPSLKLETQITALSNSNDVPDNCSKYDVPVTPCNQQTEQDRKANWRKQSMLFHPDKVPQECQKFTDGKITLLNNCCDKNDSYKPNKKNCKL